MTTGVVVFDAKAFKLRFPEFGNVPDPTLTTFFNEAGALYVDNTVNSRIDQVEQRQPILWLATAHLLALNVGVNGQAPSQLVGRIDSATEGSVTVSATMDLKPGTAQWWNQTKYGAQFWAATAQMRTMRYVGRYWPRSPALPWPWGSCR